MTAAALVLLATTSGALAVANLDARIARGGEGLVDLLLARARFLGDHDALDRAVAAAEGGPADAESLLARARARAAAHRFADALADAEAAVRAGARRDRAAAVRTAALVATGRAEEVVSELECVAALRPAYDTHAALGAAYAAVGRFAEADASYAAALAALRTTSPFPYAWMEFARGVMWTEDAGDPVRGAAAYRRALAALPEFAAAHVHLAEIEAARGDLADARDRVARVALRSDEPEAWALVGALDLRAGNTAAGRAALERARGRFEALLARQPLAFADHAAEFFLGPGADAARADVLARANLANRPTARAAALARRAAAASRR